MIPMFGWMIGSYILTRMVESLISRSHGILVKVFSTVTALIALLRMAALFGSPTPSM